MRIRIWLQILNLQFLILNQIVIYECLKKFKIHFKFKIKNFGNMNIAIFTNNYLPNPYGVSGSIESFRKELEKMEHTVYIFAPAFKGYADENPNVFRYPSIDLKFKDVRFPIVIPYSYRIDRILNELEIDIIHSQHPNLLGWAAKKWAKKKNVPLVFTWHTLYDRYAHYAPLIPSKLAAWWTIRNSVNYANKADQVIVPTPSVGGIIRKWGVENSNMSSMPTGVDEGLYQNPDGKVIREKYAVGDGEKLLLTVSRLTVEKNVSFLISSLIPLIKNSHDLKFLIVGDGDQKNSFENIVSSEGLNDKIFFSGIVDSSEMKNYYAAADIFVFASKSETQGMILSEAMFMGLPIVAVNATGSKDIVRNESTGILVEDNEKDFSAAVMGLAQDENKRKEFSENAKRIAREEYTSDICARALVEVYEATIANKK